MFYNQETTNSLQNNILLRPVCSIMTTFFFIFWPSSPHPPSSQHNSACSRPSRTSWSSGHGSCRPTSGGSRRSFRRYRSSSAWSKTPVYRCSYSSRQCPWALAILSSWIHNSYSRGQGPFLSSSLSPVLNFKGKSHLHKQRTSRHWEKQVWYRTR